MTNFESITSIESALTAVVTEHVQTDFPKRLGDLGRLVKIQGIAWDAFDAANLEKSAEAVAELLTQTGVFKEVEIRRAEVDGKVGAPAIVARRPAKKPCSAMEPGLFG